MTQKVLIVSDFSHPNYIGGVARHVREVFEEIHTSTSDEWRLITRAPAGQYATKAKDSLWELWKQTGVIQELNWWQYLLPFSFLRFVYSANRVHVHHPIMGFWAILLAKLFKKTVVHHFHGPFAEEFYLKTGRKGIIYFCYNCLQKLLLNLSDNIPVHSDYMRQWVQKIAPKAVKKVCQMPPFVDTKKFRPPVTPEEKALLRQRLGIASEASVFLTTRRLTARTGVLELVKMWPEIEGQLKTPAYLLVSGCGELENQIKSSAGPNVKLLGYVSDEDLPALYRMADAYILPTLNLEGFGYVILEALASGIPVLVSSTSGGAKEFVEKINPELIFEMKASKSLIKAIRKALDICSDKEQYVSIARAHSLKRLANFYLEFSKTKLKQ